MAQASPMAGWPAVLVSLSNPGSRAVGVSLRPAQGGRPAPAESQAVALELLPVQLGPGARLLARTARSQPWVAGTPCRFKCSRQVLNYGVRIIKRQGQSCRGYLSLYSGTPVVGRPGLYCPPDLRRQGHQDQRVSAVAFDSSGGAGRARVTSSNCCIIC